MAVLADSTTNDVSTKRAGRRWALQVACAAVVPLLLLGVIEGALRRFGVGFPTDLTVPCTVQGHAADAR